MGEPLATLPNRRFLRILAIAGYGTQVLTRGGKVVARGQCGCCGT
jgi:hypothetical protein